MTMERKLGIKYEQDGLYVAFENNNWVSVDTDDNIIYDMLISNIQRQNNVTILIPGQIYPLNIAPENIIVEYKYLQKGICNEKPYEEWKTVPKSTWDKQPFFLQKKEVARIVW